MKVKTLEVDCECFEDLAIRQGINIISKEEKGDNICNYAFARADGSKGWAREKSIPYAADAYATTIEVYDTPLID